MLWLGMAMMIARRDQRPWVAAFFIASMVMMRLLSELMGWIGYPDGLLGLIKTFPVHTRALVVYSLTYIIYMGFLYYSPGARGMLLMAASIGFFFTAFFTTAIVMIL